MNAPTKLLGLVLMLSAAGFSAAAGVGRAVGPVSAATEIAHTPDAAGHADSATMAGTSHGAAATPGLASASAGYTLQPATSRLSTGMYVFSFRIAGPDGTPLTRYAAQHDRELHFIVVRRDLFGYQHLHPTLAADGTWTVPLTLPAPGVYKAFADFQPAGAASPSTLAVDLFVPGNFQPEPLPQPAPSANVDGYTVALTGTLQAGRESELTFTVAKEGRPVTNLQPYLGAYGHLVALRVGDLAYVHVHPEGAPGDGHTTSGPQVSFHAELPTAGAYRLFLDFQVDGVVHTAAFSATAGE